MILPAEELAELRRQEVKTLRNISTLKMLGKVWNDTSSAVNDLTGQLEAIMARIVFLERLIG